MSSPFYDSIIEAVDNFLLKEKRIASQNRTVIVMKKLCTEHVIASQ